MLKEPCNVEYANSVNYEDELDVENESHKSSNFIFTLNSPRRFESLQVSCNSKDENDLSVYRETEQTPQPASSQINLWSTTFALCFCMMAHSYLLISVFPYSGYMAVDLLAHKGVTEETAGTYAGVLASALMIGRAVTAYGWGKVADRYGRTIVLYISLTMASVLSLSFGLSTSFTWALVLRFCLGMSNGILGTLRTTVSEIAMGDEKFETKTMTIIMGMWSWAFLVFPAISGALAEPVRQYPHTRFVEQRGVLFHLLNKFPFLLPNLMGSLLCFIAFWCVLWFVRETLPAAKRRDPRRMLNDILSHVKAVLCWRRNPRQKQYERLDRSQLELSFSRDLNMQDEDGNTEDSSTESRENEQDCENENEDEEVKEQSSIQSTATSAPATMLSILARSQTRTYLLVYWSASFVSVAFNEIFPLFCMSKVAGLGLEERQIGQIMSLCGLIFAVSQYGANSWAYSRFGLLGSVRAGAVLGTPMIVLIPFSLLLNRGAEPGQLHLTTIVFLATVLALNRICVMVFYSNVAVAMNRSVPPDHRGTAQGVCCMGENVAKGLGPCFAGVLTSSAVSALSEYGSILIFAVIGIIAVGFTICAVFFLRDGTSLDDELAIQPEEPAEEVELLQSEQSYTKRVVPKR